MAYGTNFFKGESLKVIDIFNVRLKFSDRLFIITYLTSGFFFWLPSYYLVRSRLRFGDRGAKLFLRTNKLSPAVSWICYFGCAYFGLFDANLTTFGDDYAQAWREKLEKRGPGTLDLKIFVGKDAFSVPIRCQIGYNGSFIAGGDKETFRHLGMWYGWMQAKRAMFSDNLIPRRLIRVDKVETVGSLRVPGKFVDTYDLGCKGSTYVAFLFDPSQATGKDITSRMMAVRDTHGLDFVRVWDRPKLCMIALVPFVFSVVFAVVWIGVSIGKFKVDAQVAVQTAFTVVGFIVTAGALLVALLAFLDHQSG